MFFTFFYVKLRQLTSINVKKGKNYVKKSKIKTEKILIWVSFVIIECSVL